MNSALQQEREQLAYRTSTAARSAASRLTSNLGQPNLLAGHGSLTLVQMLPLQSFYPLEGLEAGQKCSMCRYPVRETPKARLQRRSQETGRHV
jgi:hypothetical protein